MIVFYDTVFIYFLVIPEIMLGAQHLAGVFVYRLESQVVHTIEYLIREYSASLKGVGDGRYFVEGCIFNFLWTLLPPWPRLVYGGKGMGAGTVLPIGKSADCSCDGGDIPDPAVVIVAPHKHLFDFFNSFLNSIFVFNE